MNESTLVQLKIIVERAVRPVRATIGRKRKMREELLAHVSAVFEEEAKLGDEAAALERTAQRFGAPDLLTRQLQAAVPARDRMAANLESVIGFPPSGSKLRLASRHALLVLVITTAATALMIGLQIVATGEWREWLTVARIPSILAPVNMAFLMFCASLLWQSMTQSLFGRRGRSWPRILGLGVAAWLLVPAFMLVYCFALTGDFVASLIDVLPLLLPGLLAPLALVCTVYVCIAEIRFCEEWASLPIGAEGREPAWLAPSRPRPARAEPT
jgi:hypothetical protein